MAWNIRIGEWYVAEYNEDDNYYLITPDQSDAELYDKGDDVAVRLSHLDIKLGLGNVCRKERVTSNTEIQREIRAHKKIAEKVLKLQVDNAEILISIKDSISGLNGRLTKLEKGGKK